jgi:hypothetical protein
MRCVQNEFYDTNPLDNLNPSFDSSSCGSFECSKFENTDFNSGCKNFVLASKSPSRFHFGHISENTV